MITYFTIENFLSENECNNILNFSLKNLKLNTAKIIDTNINTINKVRKSSVSFHNYNQFDFIKKRLYSEVVKKMPLKGYEINFENNPLQFTEYKTTEFYNWHTDSTDDENTPYSKRYCSIVIQLNDAYTGGELQMNIIDELQNNEIITFKKGKGNLFVFLSNTLHRVTEVESGVRYSLVGWFNVKKLENYKKTLI